MTKSKTILNNIIVCACGCDLALLEFDNRGRSRRYIHGHNERGAPSEKHHMWKGGRMISTHGYVLVRAQGHPKAYSHGHYMQEHILVMEKHIGRYLDNNEVVHHKDGNRQNNNIENLELMTRSQHMVYHRASDWRDQKQ